MEAKRPIYLDGHATTPVAEDVLEGMLPFFRVAFANPASSHPTGRAAAAALSEARRAVAQLVGASPEEVVFTSGATESINLAILGFCGAQEKNVPRIGLARVEHKAVIATVQALEKRGLAEIRWLEVDQRGQVCVEDVERACSAGLDLLCVMKANNEVGTVYPVEALSATARTYGVSVFTDATQAVGWIAPSEALYGADALALSAHKIHGPKGVGALVLSGGFPVGPVYFGGAPDGGLRPGTRNVAGVVGLGLAASTLVSVRDENATRVREIRNRFEATLRSSWSDLIVNGDTGSRLPNNSHVAFPGIPNDLLLARASSEVCFSLGSACNASEDGPSHVLEAMGLGPEIIETSVRFGFTMETSLDEADEAAAVMLRHLSDVSSVLRPASVLPV